MHDPTNFFIQQQLRRIESQIDLAIQRTPYAKTLGELNAHRLISMPAYLRQQARALPQYRRMKDALTKRSEEIVAAHLDHLASIQPQPGQTPEDYAKALRSEYGNLQARHWCFLRGHEPLVLQQANRKAELLIQKQIKDFKEQASA